MTSDGDAAWPAGEASPTRSLAEALAHPVVRHVAAVLAAHAPIQADVGSMAAPPRRAAVALVLRVDRQDAVELLFIRRAEFVGDPWSGHVAFPGGRHEPGDATLWDTAIRETREELALDLSADGRLLGALDELYPRTATLPSIVVRPHVVVASPRAPLVPSEEVAAAFWVPLSVLRAGTTRRPSTVRTRGRELVVPSFVHDGHTIWGMTERILHGLLERLA